MKRLFVISCAVTMFLLMVASPVLSLDQEKTPFQKGACKVDIEKFCKDIKPDDGRLIACLKSHEKQLSKACKNLMSEKAAAKRSDGVYTPTNK